MFWLGLSGILLNQSPILGLDAKRIDWPWLMSLYGLHAELPKTGFMAGNHWLTASGTALVFDGLPLDASLAAPIGFTIAGQGKDHYAYVANADALVISTMDGKVIDQLDSSTLPVDHLQRIGTTVDGREIVVGGSKTFASADGGLTWYAWDASQVTWSHSAPLSAEQARIAGQFGRPSVPIEQILIDLHSGRMFGQIGQYVVDVVGGGAVLLALSGMWMALRIGRRRVAVR
jgi:hypothetical protein